jgi:hypothetical protein
MKYIINKLVKSKIFDALFSLVIIVPAFFMLFYRNVGSRNLKLSTKMLQKIGIFPIKNHYYEPLFNFKKLRHPLNSNRKLPGLLFNNVDQLNLLRELKYANELISLDLTKNPKSKKDFNLKNGSFEADDTQRALILVGVAATLLFDNSRTLKSIVKKIKEEGLMETFEIALVKGMELKTSFTRFLESLNTSIGSLSELVSYSFLIPIIGDIEKIITKNTDILLVSETIAERMISSGVVLVSAAVLVEVIEKIIRRLS